MLNSVVSIIENVIGKYKADTKKTQEEIDAEAKEVEERNRTHKLIIRREFANELSGLTFPGEPPAHLKPKPPKKDAPWEEWVTYSDYLDGGWRSDDRILKDLARIYFNDQ